MSKINRRKEEYTRLGYLNNQYEVYLRLVTEKSVDVTRLKSSKINDEIDILIDDANFVSFTRLVIV